MYAKQPEVGLLLFLEKQLKGLPEWVLDEARQLALKTWKAADK